jgi:hypothetical protein
MCESVGGFPNATRISKIVYDFIKKNMEKKSSGSEFMRDAFNEDEWIDIPDRLFKKFPDIFFEQLRVTFADLGGAMGRYVVGGFADNGEFGDYNKGRFNYDTKKFNYLDIFVDLWTTDFELQSVISHELSHAYVDYCKICREERSETENRYKNEKSKYSTDGIEYFSNPDELNSFLSEIDVDLSNMSRSFWKTHTDRQVLDYLYSSESPYKVYKDINDSLDSRNVGNSLKAKFLKQYKKMINHIYHIIEKNRK